MPEPTDTAAEELAAELKQRGVPLPIVLKASQIMMEDDPQGLETVIAFAMQAGFPLGVGS